MIEIKVSENIQNIKSIKEGYVLVNPEGKCVSSITMDFASFKANVGYSDIAECIHIYSTDFFQNECNGFMSQVIKDHKLTVKPVTYSVNLSIMV